MARARDVDRIDLGRVVRRLWGSTWITKPLGTLVGTTLTLAGGDTGVAIGGGDRKDEIGGMARAVAVFRDNAIERARLEEAASAEQAQREAHQRPRRRADRTVPHLRLHDAGGPVGENATRMDVTAKSLSGVATAASAQATGAAAASAAVLRQCAGSVAESAAEDHLAPIAEIRRAGRPRPDRHGGGGAPGRRRHAELRRARSKRSPARRRRSATWCG